jgi:pimeloyl-ACP methyl ester carboxylesterase
MSAIPGASETSEQPTDHQRKRGCLSYVKRGLKWFGVGILVLLILGFAYQIIATEMDKRNFLPPGQLLEVDGHDMHILCTGEGSPTVILEAAGGHFSSTWALVQPIVAESSRVCAYDRAGYGWSEPGPEPREAQRIASELHSLLEQAGVESPYVMVGHSVGGIYVRVFHAQYPGEVMGMVLVDSTHPDNWARQGESIQTLQTAAAVSAVLSRFGLMRLAFSGQEFGLPSQDNAALKANISSSQYWDTQRADTAAMVASLEQGRAAGDLGDLPLVVLAAVDYPEGTGRDTELSLQSELAALSTNSLYQETAGARHITLVTDERYALFVSEAIIQVVEAVRTTEPLAS